MSATVDSREYRELQAEYRAVRALNVELLEALEQCSSCLSDMMNNKGGWAWEEVVDHADEIIRKAHQ